MSDEQEGLTRGGGWTDLFRCFRIATDPVKVCLGFYGVVFSVLMLLLALFLYLQVMSFRGGATSSEALGRLWAGELAGTCSVLGEGARMTLIDLRLDLADIGRSTFRGDLLPALARADTVQKVVPWAVVFLLLLWLPWAYFGGAINRAAAVEYATGERLFLPEARSYAAARYSAYLWPPPALAVGIGLLLAANMLAGVAAAHLLSAAVFVLGVLASLYGLVAVKQKTGSSRTGGLVGLIGLAATAAVAWALWPVGLGWVQDLVLVLLFPVLVVLSLAAVLLSLVLLVGRGYMLSAVSFEGTGTFDALSRAGDYVLRRPWRLAFSVLVGVVYFAFCAVFVAGAALGAFLVAGVTAWLGFGAGFVPVFRSVFGPSASCPIGAWLPGFLLTLFFALLCAAVAGWWASFCHSFWAIAYALVRRDVDGSGPNEVFVEPDLSAAPPLSPADQQAEPSEQ